MIALSLGLAVLAAALAWPVPVALSRAAWPSRRPVAAMVLWQAVGLVGGLSMIGSLVLAGFAVEHAGDELTPVSTATWVLWGFAALLSLHLIGTLVVTGVRMDRRRRRHLQALRLVAHESPEARGRLVVDSELPLAYCLPSTGGSITVVTEGILRALSPEELDAVLTHEKAHLTQRHDYLIWAFSAWRTALPWLPTSKLALESVAELIEYLADDRAVREHSSRSLARALLLVSHETSGLHASDDDAGSGAAPADETTEAATSSPATSNPAATGTGLAGRTVRRAMRLVGR